MEFLQYATGFMRKANRLHEQQTFCFGISTTWNRFHEVVKSIAGLPSILFWRIYSMQSIAWYGKIDCMDIQHFVFWNLTLWNRFDGFVKSIATYTFSKNVNVTRHLFNVTFHSRFPLSHGIYSWRIGNPSKEVSLSLYIFWIFKIQI